MSLAYVAVGTIAAGAIGGIYASNQAKKAADKASDVTAVAADRQAAIGERQQDLAETQYADSKKLLEEYAPLFRQQIELSTAEQAKSVERGDQQWASYQRDFQPVEQKLASTALNFDTPQRRDQAAGDAVGSVSTAFDNARAGTQRSLADAGVKVGSGAAATLDAQSRIEQAKASAGAANQARTNVETQGLGLVDNAARFGRGMPSTGIAVAGLAGQQGAQAQGTFQNLATATAQPTSAAIGGLGSAASTNNSAANLYLNAFGAKTNAANQQAAMYGDIAGAGAQMFGAIKSSRKLKKVGRKADGLDAAKAVAKSPSKEWAYKPGLGDGDTRKRVGPIAEELQKVAPTVSNGKEIDGISLLGLHHAAIGGQQKQLDRIEKKLDHRLGLSDAKTHKTARKAA